MNPIDRSSKTAGILAILVFGVNFPIDWMGHMYCWGKTSLATHPLTSFPARRILQQKGEQCELSTHRSAVLNGRSGFVTRLTPVSAAGSMAMLTLAVDFEVQVVDKDGHGGPGVRNVRSRGWRRFPMGSPLNIAMSYTMYFTPDLASPEIYSVEVTYW